MRPGQQRNRWLAAAAMVALVAAVPVVNTVRHRSAEAAAALAGDGTTSETAGASCWGIKQQYASSASGVYWLQTLPLERPGQFYCDMTTGGGGWVLIGRGRQGWTFSPFGQGSPVSLRTAVDGPNAFAPAALSADTVNGLLNNTSVSALPDGVRIERATRSDGSTRQDFRLYMTNDRWTWGFQAGQILSKVVVDSKTTYQGSNTLDTSSSSVPGQTVNQLAGKQKTDRMFTSDWVSHNRQRGFSFGSGLSGGSSSATNYLWTYNTEGSPIPFTRVWIRPRIANGSEGFTPIPATGYPAEAKPAELKSKSEVAPWGVVGLDHTGETTIEPYNTNVLAMQPIGETMFVGGRFSGVQQGPSGTPVDQKYLAAFDVRGNWISSFRPTLTGRVWDMLALPDGKLLIAGDFSSVNGEPNTSGMAKLDPATGAVDTTFKANAFKADGSKVLVRALDQADGIVYAAGNFNRYTGGSAATLSVSSAISLRATDGTPTSWRPRLTGSAVRIRVTKAKDRVLLAGYFASINGDTNQGYFGITDIATGAPSPGIGTWIPSTGANAKYQQAVDDLGDGRYLVGGSEHDFQVWDSQRTSLLDSTITKTGGDTQVIEQVDGKVFIGCHCGNAIYLGTNNWQSPSGFRQVDQINLVTALDASGSQLKLDTSWSPSGLKGQTGEGIWAVEKASDGCVWVGGDLVNGAYSGNPATDWLGGFARFCPEDATPPSTPTKLAATLAGSSVNLSWGASTDASGTVSYDVYRNDRVIATVWGTSFTDPELIGSARYTVRATDARGNRSASPAPVNVNGPATKIATVVAFGSTWKYKDDGSNQGTAWRAAGFNEAGWASGPGQLGWGVTNATTIGGTTKPITVYFRSTFNVADPTQVKVLNLRTKVLSGSVVYVNGVEVSRYNMPQGAVTSTTTAAGYLTSTQEREVGSVVIPGSLLTKGVNQLAVEVHNNRAGSTRSWFDLEATTYGSGGDTTSPTAPTLSGTIAFPNVNLSWTPSSDDTAIGGYLIRRDGQTLAVTGAASTTYVDGSVDTTTPHTYQLVAFDNTGNTVSSNSISVAAVANPNLLPYGATWRWTYPSGGLAAGWQEVGFDDRTWASGPAELGYGDGDEKTVISTAPTPRPLTAYFRTTVNVPNPSAFSSVLAQLIRDDGAIVYVNGVEVGRDNMPAGPVTGSTASSTIISDRTAEQTPVTISIPASAFVAGTNTIAVEVHNSDGWSGDLSFDLKLTGTS